MSKRVAGVLFITFLALSSLYAQDVQKTDPTKLLFHRLATRRYIFSNNIPLNELKPDELVNPSAMHPALAVSNDAQVLPDKNTHLIIDSGLAVFSGDSNNKRDSSTINVGGVNPFATYELDVRTVKCEKNDVAELGVDLAASNLQNRIQVIAHYGGQEGVYLRV